VSVGPQLDVREEIRQRIDIADLVGSYLTLQRQGRVLVGLCPWHDDSRPSLRVDPDRQSFKCWVCNIGGDIFSFVQQMEKVSFPEAKRMLAERAGVAMAGRPDRSADGATRESPEGESEKAELLGVMRWAAAAYHDCLIRDPAGEPARLYLAERGISHESIQRFLIGYAPDRWDWIGSQARKEPWSESLLIGAGLLIPRPGGSGSYDRFRGRVTFPIRDLQGRPIALGGRILPQHAQESAAKYVNSPETRLFSKARQLYGLDLARAALSKQKTAVVVEGYTDCIMAHQHGFDNVVAVLGTALGEEHVRLLRRHADKVVLMLDGDEAGRRRANEVLKLFVAVQVDLRILTLPENLDPCDFLRAHGGDAMARLMAESVDVLEHKMRMVTQGLDPTTDTLRTSAALEEILATLATVPRSALVTRAELRVREEQILARLARWSGVTGDALRGRMAELRRAVRTRRAAEPPASQPAACDMWDRTVLEAILCRPTCLSQIAGQIRAEDMQSEVSSLIYRLCLELWNGGETPSYERLMLQLEDLRAKSLLVELDEACRAKSETDRQLELEQILESYHRRKEDERNRVRIAALRAQPAGQAQLQAFGELIAALQDRHRKPDPTDG
jgi:DNA primase